MINNIYLIFLLIKFYGVDLVYYGYIHGRILCCKPDVEADYSELEPLAGARVFAVEINTRMNDGDQQLADVAYSDARGYFKLTMDRPFRKKNKGFLNARTFYIEEKIEKIFGITPYLHIYYRCDGGTVN